MGLDRLAAGTRRRSLSEETARRIRFGGAARGVVHSLEADFRSRRAELGVRALPTQVARASPAATAKTHMVGNANATRTTRSTAKDRPWPRSSFSPRSPKATATWRLKRNI